MKSWFTFGYPEGNGQLILPLLPITNRRSLGLFRGPRFDYRWKDATGLLGGGYAKQKQEGFLPVFVCFIERTYGTVSKF